MRGPDDARKDAEAYGLTACAYMEGAVPGMAGVQPEDLAYRMIRIAHAYALKADPTLRDEAE